MICRVKAITTPISHKTSLLQIVLVHRPCSIVKKHQNKSNIRINLPLRQKSTKAHIYKVDKNTDFESDLEAKGWKMHLVPFEVSSRGQILKHTQTHTFNTRKVFDIKFRTNQKLTKNMSKISLFCTFPVFHAFQTKEWITPALPETLDIFNLSKLSCSW